MATRRARWPCGTSLLADAPANSPLHQTLVDRIALLTARGGAARPIPQAMVAGLAARLKAIPNDAAGWQRLIRAYTVLGERDKAQAALADGAQDLAGQREPLAALDAEARELKLNCSQNGKTISHCEPASCLHRRQPRRLHRLPDGQHRLAVRFRSVVEASSARLRALDRRLCMGACTRVPPRAPDVKFDGLPERERSRSVCWR